MSYVGEGLLGRACMGGYTTRPPEDPAGQHGCGCMMLSARTKVNQRWFRKGSSLGSRYLTRLSANG